MTVPTSIPRLSSIAVNEHKSQTLLDARASTTTNEPLATVRSCARKPRS